MFVFRHVKKEYFIPLYQYLILDYDLFGTMGMDKVVNFFIQRKADVAIQAANALFKLTSDTRFIHREENIKYYR